MASAFPDKKGQYSVQFTLRKKRETIYLGRVAKHWADNYSHHTQLLVDALRYREPVSRKTQQWLAGLAPEFREKLAKYQLVEAVPVGTIAQLCDHAIAEANVKPATLLKYQDAKANLVDFFGADRLLHQITPGQAQSFFRWLIKHGSRKPQPLGPLAETTAGVRCKQARQFFASAVKHRWLDENPFESLTLGSTENPECQEYVPLDTVEKLFAYAPPALQLMLACSRYGGIRMMSEMRALRWEWVNFAEGTVTVFSPKNERYKHKKWRVVPMYDAWKPYLQAAWESAPDGSEYVLHADRELTDTAYRNRLERVCLRAGVLPWSSLWQSMRGSRATDLIDEGFPEHVVCYWQNDSPKTLRRHYLRVTKEHYAKATALPTKLDETPVEPGVSALMQNIEPDASDDSADFTVVRLRQAVSDDEQKRD